MGCMVDVMLDLVDPKSFTEIIEMPLSEIYSGMEERSLRQFRPDHDRNFHREFDADLEGEILDLIDRFDDLKAPLPPINVISESAVSLGVLLAKWSSVAQWRCWEARLFLYVEPHLAETVPSSEDFLSPEIWHRFSDALSNTDRLSYSESVVLDWMSRREEMGETMEPSEDPRILPTMESHRKLSETLFSIVEKSRTSNHQLLLGREFLEGKEWSLGSSKLSNFWGL